MKIGVVGFGREGRSVYEFIKKMPLFRGAEIWVLDKNPSLQTPRGARKRLGKNYLKNLWSFDLLFRSPGIPYNRPEFIQARKKGVQFSGATRLFFENCPTKNIIGITGTKGKGTTSTLLYQILKTAGKNVFLAGNIGKSALDILPKLKRFDAAHRKKPWVVLELSSFQLQDLKTSPHIAVVLDVFPDHQDAHLSLKEYYGAKTNIARHQGSSDKVFFFSNNRLSRWVAEKSPPSARLARLASRAKRAGGGRGKKIAVDPDNFRLFGPTDLKIFGSHNFKNAVMAATIARHLGVPKKTIIKAVKNFWGLEHRLELVRTIITKPLRLRGKIKRHSHILTNVRMSFYNDSASTNPQTTAVAINAFPNQPKILIVGGQDKGLDYAPLADALKNSNTKLVVLFGENKHKIKRQIAKSKTQIVLKKNLETSVKTAYQFAKKLTTYYLLPTTILFSPGAASFDQFRDYADRGKKFKKLVLRRAL